MSQTFNKFQQFVEDLANGVYNLKTGTSHSFKVMLTNTAPVATNAVYADVSATELANGNGYTTGGASAGTVTGAQTTGTFKFTLGSDPTWTAATGTMGPFRYAILYDVTPTSPLKPLICWWDYASSISLAVGESFTVDLDQTNGILTIV
jgi:hypothetical protein